MHKGVSAARPSRRPAPRRHSARLIVARSLSRRADRPIEPGAVDDVEWIGLKQGADPLDGGGRQRNEIGIAAHEADELAVGNHLHDVAGEKRAAAATALRPMQHRAAGEMAAAADQRDAARERKRIAVPQLDREIWPHDPLPIGGVQMDGRVEGMRPFHHRRIIVRMGNGDADEAAQRFDDGDGGVVGERDTVPQHVARRGGEQERALSDGEGGHRADADQAGLVLAETVAMTARQRLVRGPALARWRHELALLIADRAAGGLFLGGCKLRPAGAADVGWHGPGACG